ncbi:MAG: DUF350 domain-containing protein [Byssovorax sp.]
MELTTTYVMLFGAAEALGLLLILLVGQRLLAPAHTIAKDLAAGNTAHGLLEVGEVLGIFLIAGSVVSNSVTGASLSRDILWASVFGVASLALFIATGRLGISVLMRSKLPQEIERGNVAAGLAAGASYIATGIITSRSVAGSDLRGLGLSLAFFVIAQLTLHLVIIAFRALTAYDDAEQIQSENLAAAVSYAGLTIAVALIIGRALEGDFVNWATSLAGYGKALLFVVALYPVRQILVQMAFLGGGFSFHKGSLDQAIEERRNTGAAALEAASYIATALLVARLG